MNLKRNGLSIKLAFIFGLNVIMSGCGGDSKSNSGKTNLTNGGAGGSDSPVFLLKKRERDNGIDGHIDKTETFNYDGSGYLISREISVDTGTEVQAFLSQYENDNNGNPLKESEDHGVDGTIDAIKLWSYDNRENLLFYSDDFDADGVPEHQYFATFDDQDKLQTEEWDRGEDWRWKQLYFYDDKGFLREAHTDSEADGTIEKISIFTYDNNGNLIEIADDVDYGAGFDGKTDVLYLWTYDSNHNELSQIILSNPGDAEQQQVLVEEHHAYTFNRNGDVLTKETRSSVDGPVISKNIYTYDQYGNVLSEEIHEAAPHLPYLRTFTYIQL